MRANRIVRKKKYCEIIENLRIGFITRNIKRERMLPRRYDHTRRILSGHQRTVERK